LAIRNALSLHKLPKIQFFEHFLQLSHNLRIINGHSNTTGRKTRKLDTFEKLIQAMKSRTICWKDYRTTY